MSGPKLTQKVEAYISAAAELAQVRHWAVGVALLLTPLLLALLTPLAADAAAPASAQEHKHQQLAPLHLAVAVFDDPGGVGKQAAIKAAGDEAYKSLLRCLRKRLVRLPMVEPPPEQVRAGAGGCCVGAGGCCARPASCCLPAARSHGTRC